MQRPNTWRKNIEQNETQHFRRQSDSLYRRIVDHPPFARRTAQCPETRDLPRRAIDTLDTDDSNIKIVIFTNNTWCYYYPDLNERMDREVYREHWVNDRVFAYTDIQLKELPPVIDRLREMSPLWERIKNGEIKF